MASSDSVEPSEKTFGILKSKMSFSDILRGVKVREDTLQCAVTRLGGGTQGLQVLMEYVNSWALGSQGDEDAMVAIRHGIVHLGMPITPQRHGNSEISTPSGDGACKSVSTHLVQGTAHTRALRKSHMLRQRGQTRAQQRNHPLKSKSKTQSPPCPLSTGLDYRIQLDLESEFSNGNGKGYNFLFQKVLRASDVSSLGRIVLPKKEAESHLPFLDAKEGVMLSLQDYHCGKSWRTRYRFWPNNKSRMYLLENIGDFVSFHHLQEGDLLLCYRSYRGGYVLRGEKLVRTTPAAIGLSLDGEQSIPATDVNTASTLFSETYQFVREAPSGTHDTNLAISCSDSMSCTLGEAGDVKPSQDGDSSSHQVRVSEQPGNSQRGDACSDSPALLKPLVLDEGPCSAVAMLYVNNLKQRYLDDNHFLYVFSWLSAPNIVLDLLSVYCPVWYTSVLVTGHWRTSWSAEDTPKFALDTRAGAGGLNPFQTGDKGCC